MTIYNASLKNIEKLKKNIIPNNIVICYYYSDTCPFCVMIKGLWKEICDVYKKKKNIIIISINREIMSKLNKELHIDLVPSLICYKFGKKHSEFTKTREYDNIIKFINKFDNKNIDLKI